MVQLPAKWQTLDETGDSNPGGGVYRSAEELDGNSGHPQEPAEWDPVVRLPVGISGSLKYWAKLKMENVSTEVVFDKVPFLSLPHGKQGHQLPWKLLV